MNLVLTPPEPLSSHHYLDTFDCGEPSPGEWLRRRALGNQASGASRTVVAADASGRVVRYYSSAADAVAHETATSAARRNRPDTAPVLVLGRRVVDRPAQRNHLGAALLQDAVKRAVSVAEDAGVRALLVHALGERANRFYEHYGFQASAVHPLTLMLRLPAGR